MALVKLLLFVQKILRAYYVPGTWLEAGDSKRNQRDQRFAGGGEHSSNTE